MVWGFVICTPTVSLVYVYYNMHYPYYNCLSISVGAVLVRKPLGFTICTPTVCGLWIMQVTPTNHPGLGADLAQATQELGLKVVVVHLPIGAADSLIVLFVCIREFPFTRDFP